MKKLTTNLLTLTASILLTVGGAKAQTPKDQIALQLGAIQMGYTVPFVVTESSSALQKQQAANALVMGRNAMNATVSMPAATVKGVVKSPNVNTVEYRDQLYSAVEHVVTSPVNVTVNGTVVMSNNSTVSVTPTTLTSVANEWTTPVPYALESRSSVDTQLLRDELVAAGLLTNKPVISSVNKTYFFITSTSERNSTEALKPLGIAKAQPIYNNRVEQFDQWLQRKIDSNDRIIVKDDTFWKTQSVLAEGLRETLKFSFQVFNRDTNSTSLQLWCALPATENDPSECFLFSSKLGIEPSRNIQTFIGGTLTAPIPPAIDSQVTYKGVRYKLVKIGATMSAGVTMNFKVGK